MRSDPGGSPSGTCAAQATRNRRSTASPLALASILAVQRWVPTQVLTDHPPRATGEDLRRSETAPPQPPASAVGRAIDAYFRVMKELSNSDPVIRLAFWKVRGVRSGRGLLPYICRITCCCCPSVPQHAACWPEKWAMRMALLQSGLWARPCANADGTPAGDPGGPFCPGGGGACGAGAGRACSCSGGAGAAAAAAQTAAAAMAAAAVVAFQRQAVQGRLVPLPAQQRQPQQQ